MHYSWVLLSPWLGFWACEAVTDDTNDEMWFSFLRLIISSFYASASYHYCIASSNKFVVNVCTQVAAEELPRAS